MDKIEYAEVRLNDGDGNDYINFYVDGITHSYLLEEVYEQMQNMAQTMPCGHLARYQVEENGTQYCALCEIEDLQESLQASSDSNVALVNGNEILQNVISFAIRALNEIAEEKLVEGGRVLMARFALEEIEKMKVQS